MRKLMSVSLLVTTLLAATQPGWTGKLPKYSTGQQLMQTIRGGNRIRTRSGQEWRLLNDFTRSLTPQALQRQLQTGRSFSALRQLQTFDARRSFSTLTAEQPPLRAVLNMIDIQGFMMQHGDQFPTPQDTETFKKVLEVLVFAQTKQIDGSVKDMLAGLYAGPESPVTPAALPTRVQDIDGWMKNTPPQVQLAAVQAALFKINNPKNTAPQKATPSNAAPQKANPSGAAASAPEYYPVDKAQNILFAFSKENSRNSRFKQNALPTPFGNVDAFWAVLSLINEERGGKLSEPLKENMLSLALEALRDKYENPQRLRQEVRAWQGLQQKWPALPDPAQYKTASDISQAAPAKKLEWKLAVDGWYLKNLIPEEEQPAWLRDWNVFGGLAKPDMAQAATSALQTARVFQLKQKGLEDVQQALKELARERAGAFKGTNYPGMFATYVYLLTQQYAGNLTHTEMEDFRKFCERDILNDEKYTLASYYDQWWYNLEELYGSGITLPHLPPIAGKSMKEAREGTVDKMRFEMDIVQAIQEGSEGTKALYNFAVRLRILQLFKPENLAGSRWEKFNVFAKSANPTPAAASTPAKPQTLAQISPEIIKDNNRLLEQFAVSKMANPYYDDSGFVVLRTLLQRELNNQLTVEQKERFLEICRSIIQQEELMFAENFAEEELKQIHVNYGFEEMPFLPSSEKYPSVEKIRNASHGWHDLWFLAAKVRVAQLASKITGRWANYDVRTGKFKEPAAKPAPAPRPNDIPRISANTTRHNRQDTPQSQETPMFFQNPNRVLGVLKLPSGSLFPNVEAEPQKFLAVLFLLQKWEANELSSKQQEEFLNKLKGSSLGSGSEIWPKETFDDELDYICYTYNIKKTLSLPSVKDYPTVQSIQKENIGLQKLWSVLLALRATQLAFPERLDPELRTLKLPFHEKPVK